MSFTSCLAVAFGGAFGSLARYLVSVVAQPISGSLPWGTIIINIAGSFIIGLFGTLTLAQGRFPVSENVRLLVMVGICGGFTTFSSFSLQTLDLMRSGAMGRAAVNIVASVVLCVGAVALGHFTATYFNADQRIVQLDIEEESGPTQTS
ncbi:fluoride efflux transporter CrcB [Aquamicrobium sp. NLF2-7]|jgi:CrcB protein|uniref:Fluoride-specific ion channel FluC n=1 Tax=Aquamicrobium lusatiense TaxID=89772 RepID=A0A7W9VWE0_9HYPH|nr:MULTISPECIES: fluoride efflux transporter CrcB [Aquamicrobium]MBB6013200.1 CrcB protein [Aquamicrobium lusatiense]MCG8270702.1 fluoride efflux transporter CrcB [Aquamicrobium sp. NLF2-7]MCK9552555.1 fluoride efflux transporter CrcB [Aquamicrobium sp.]